MARPVDQTLRESLIEALMDAVSWVGIGNLSLRALSRELAISPRMLLYHFGSRDGMLDAIVEETSRRLAAATITEGRLADILLESWRWMTADEQRGFVNVFYEVCALGARDEERRGPVAASLFGDWHALLVLRGVPDTTATLILATMHGLLLDLILTGDRGRLERAFAAFVEHYAYREEVVS